jgi:two-component system nitrate/nitrite response regulator NarL
MKILFVDKQEILLDGIANLLAKSAHDLVENANSIGDALQYFSEAEFDILITDFNLVDDNGLALIRKVKKIYPKLKIIVLSMRDEAHLVEEILKTGSTSYVLKKNSHQNLVGALDSIEKGKIILNTDINKILFGSTSQNKKGKLLSEREKEILKLISDEHSTKEIAEKLAVTEKTIESHKKNIFKKTKTSSEIGLLKYAYANNII